MIVKMFKELRRRLNEQSEKLDVFNGELRNINKNRIEMKSAITEMNNTLKGFNICHNWNKRRRKKESGIEEWNGTLYCR